MINEMADVSVDPSIDREQSFRVVVVKIKQVSHAVGIVHLTTPFCLLVRYHLR